jgi:hypothetical protein
MANDDTLKAASFGLCDAHRLAQLLSKSEALDLQAVYSASSSSFSEAREQISAIFAKLYEQVRVALFGKRLHECGLEDGSNERIKRSCRTHGDKAESLSRSHFVRFFEP